MFDPSSITFNGKELQELSKAIVEGAMPKEAIEKYHTIVEGIKAKQQVVVLGQINEDIGISGGQCDSEGRVLTTTPVELFWEPAPVSDKFSWCWETDVKDSFFDWGSKNGIQRHELENTDFALYAEEILIEAIKKMHYRIFYFSDVDADNFSGTGVITDGINLATVNKFDGFFKRWFAIGAANPTQVTAGLATKNAQATYALQAFNDTDTTNRVVTRVFQNMEFNADERLTAKENVRIMCTKTMGDQYKRELLAAESAFTIERLQNGFDVIKSAGREVTVVSQWDANIKKFHDDGAAYYLPHRAVMLTPENNQIGTEEAGTLTGYKIWYSEDTEKVFVKFLFNADTQVPETYLIQLAY